MKEIEPALRETMEPSFVYRFRLITENMKSEQSESTTKNTSEKASKNSKYPRAFNARASEKEYKKLKNLSFFTGKSLSRLVIETTLSAPLRGAAEVRSEQADREEMIFQLRRIGINLNQITSALHAASRENQASLMETELEKTTAEIESVISALKKKL